MVLVVAGRVGTTMMSRKMKRFSTVSTFLKKLEKLKPVGNHKRDREHGQHANPFGIHQT